MRPVGRVLLLLLAAWLSVFLAAGAVAAATKAAGAWLLAGSVAATALVVAATRTRRFAP